MIKLTRTLIWEVLIISLIVYWGLVYLVGFEGPVAIATHFLRVALAIAVVIMYTPKIIYLFRERPTPRRDYLLVGIILTAWSGTLFAFWNEFGRIFRFENATVFNNPIAGLFSLILATGFLFLVVAPDMGGKPFKLIALATGAFISGFVFIAPLIFWWL